MVFPISCVMSFANFCRFPARAAQAFLTSSVRSWRDRAFHKGCAVRAAATAASISAEVDTRTRWMTAPVAGFVSTICPFSMTTPCTMLVARLVGGRAEAWHRAEGSSSQKFRQRAGLEDCGEDAPKERGAEVRADDAAVGVGGDRCGPRMLCMRCYSSGEHARARLQAGSSQLSESDLGRGGTDA